MSHHPPLPIALLIALLIALTIALTLRGDGSLRPARALHQHRFRSTSVISKIDHRHERRLAMLYTLTAMLGFCTDAAVLKGGMALGLSAAIARFISLFCAMQVTFWINGLFVFKSVERRRVVMQWLGYMSTNGFGNLCNYLVFIALVSSRWPIVSNRWMALAVGSFAAWIINYSCTRLLVFNKPAELKAQKALGLAPGELRP